MRYLKITIEVKELSDLLGVSTSTIYTMVRMNEIPHLKVRGRILFNRQVIEEWSKGTYQEVSKC